MNDIERAIIAYAGKDYADPLLVEVEKVYLETEIDGMTPDEAIAFIASFRDRHPGCTMKIEHHSYDCGDSLTLTAAKMETSAETEARIEGYRRAVLKKVAERRAEYERMKREFGDA